MSDASVRRDHAHPDQPPATGADPAAGRVPRADPVDDNLGAARAEEHGAPAPTTRIYGKHWVIGGLLMIAAIAAVAWT